MKRIAITLILSSILSFNHGIQAMEKKDGINTASLTPSTPSKSLIPLKVASRMLKQSLRDLFSNIPEVDDIHGRIFRFITHASENGAIGSKKCDEIFEEQIQNEASRLDLKYPQGSPDSKVTFSSIVQYKPAIEQVEKRMCMHMDRYSLSVEKRTQLHAILKPKLQKLVANNLGKEITDTALDTLLLQEIRTIQSKSTAKKAPSAMTSGKTSQHGTSTDHSTGLPQANKKIEDALSRIGKICPERLPQEINARIRIKIENYFKSHPYAPIIPDPILIDYIEEAQLEQMLSNTTSVDNLKSQKASTGVVEDVDDGQYAWLELRQFSGQPAKTASPNPAPQAKATGAPTSNHDQLKEDQKRKLYAAGASALSINPQEYISLEKAKKVSRVPLRKIFGNHPEFEDFCDQMSKELIEASLKLKTPGYILKKQYDEQVQEFLHMTAGYLDAIKATSKPYGYKFPLLVKIKPLVDAIEEELHQQMQRNGLEATMRVGLRNLMRPDIQKFVIENPGKKMTDAQMNELIKNAQSQYLMEQSTPKKDDAKSQKDTQQPSSGKGSRKDENEESDLAKAALLHNKVESAIAHIEWSKLAGYEHNKELQEDIKLKIYIPFRDYFLRNPAYTRIPGMELIDIINNAAMQIIQEQSLNNQDDKTPQFSSSSSASSSSSSITVTASSKDHAEPQDQEAAAKRKAELRESITQVLNILIEASRGNEYDPSIFQPLATSSGWSIDSIKLLINSALQGNHAPLQNFINSRSVSELEQIASQLQ